jgi:hypothetical protein
MDDIAASVEHYYLFQKDEALEKAVEDGTSKETLLFMILEILVEKNPEFQSIKAYKKTL